MANRTENIAADPYIGEVMQEKYYRALEENLIMRSNANEDYAIAKRDTDLEYMPELTAALCNIIRGMEIEYIDQLEIGLMRTNALAAENENNRKSIAEIEKMMCLDHLLEKTEILKNIVIAMQLMQVSKINGNYYRRLVISQSP